MLCSRGLIRSNSSVKTWNARSMGAATVICVLTDVAWASVFMRPPSCWLFRDLLVGRKGFAPELVDLGAKAPHAVWVELVDPASADGPVGHQPRVLQHLQVLGHRRTSDRKLRSEFADRPRAIGKAFENRAPCRVPKSGPNSVCLVNHD